MRSQIVELEWSQMWCNNLNVTISIWSDMIRYDMDLFKAGYIDSVKRQESTSVDHNNCRIYVPTWTLGPPAVTLTKSLKYK